MTKDASQASAAPRRLTDDFIRYRRSGISIKLPKALYRTNTNRYRCCMMWSTGRSPASTLEDCIYQSGSRTIPNFFPLGICSLCRSNYMLGSRPMPSCDIIQHLVLGGEEQLAIAKHKTLSVMSWAVADLSTFWDQRVSRWFTFVNIFWNVVDEAFVMCIASASFVGVGHPATHYLILTSPCLHI